MKKTGFYPLKQQVKSSVNYVEKNKGICVLYKKLDQGSVLKSTARFTTTQRKGFRLVMQFYFIHGNPAITHLEGSAFPQAYSALDVGDPPAMVRRFSRTY